jgi:hypothetical protein
MQDRSLPYYHQHEMSNMPAEAQAIFFRRRHQQMTARDSFVMTSHPL